MRNFRGSARALVTAVLATVLAPAAALVTMHPADAASTACIAATATSTTSTASPIGVSSSWRVEYLHVGRHRARVRATVNRAVELSYQVVTTATLCDGSQQSYASPFTVQGSAERSATARRHAQRRTVAVNRATRAAVRVARRAAWSAAIDSAAGQVPARAAELSGNVYVLDPQLVNTELLKLINAHRAAIGVGQLRDLPPAMPLAWDWAHTINTSGVFAHDTSATTGYSVDLSSLPCLTHKWAYGENVATGQVGATEADLARALYGDWMSSSGHRSQIESRFWTWHVLAVDRNAGGWWTSVERFSMDDCSNLVP